MKRIIALTILLSASLMYGQTQQVMYQMKALGKNIGTSTISKRSEGDNIFYLTKSNLEVNLLIKKIRMEVENKTHYQDGKLFKSEAKVTINGKVHTYSSVIWNKGKYDVMVDGKAKKPLYRPVYYSGTLLYFNEPVELTEAFSETAGLFMPVKKEADGQYVVTDPKNNRDMLHIYKNGKLTNIKVKHPLVTVSLDLMSPKVPTR